MAHKFLSGIDFAEDPRTEPRPLPCLACVAFWNTRLDKTASARSRQKASKGSWSTVNRCQRDKLAEKTSEKAPETQPDDPVCETRIRYPAPLYLPLPSFSSSPLLLLLLLSSSSSSPRDQQSRRVFLRASKVGCTCYRFNYVRTCGPCVLRSSPTLLSIANETWRNVVRSCKNLREKRDDNFWTDGKNWILLKMRDVLAFFKDEMFNKREVIRIFIFRIYEIIVVIASRKRKEMESFYRSLWNNNSFVISGQKGREREELIWTEKRISNTWRRDYVSRILTSKLFQRRAGNPVKSIP